jgi:hypothetical protein
MQKHSFNFLMSQQSSLFRCLHQSRLNNILGKYHAHSIHFISQRIYVGLSQKIESRRQFSTQNDKKPVEEESRKTKL